MFYYCYNNQILFSFDEYPDLKTIDEASAARRKEKIYFLKKLDPHKSRKSFCISHPSLLFSREENLELLRETSVDYSTVPEWIIEKIQKREITSINTQYPNWKEILDDHPPKSWRVHIAGLGDVGGTLLIGLRLLGGKVIDTIGIFDRSMDKLNRWKYEGNQIYSIGNTNYPTIEPVEENKLFDCDLFIFCIAARVPALGEEVKDVRMIQFEENAKIISKFAKQARAAQFKGIFAVVSDPVDLLCKVVWKASNQDENGEFDFNGLSPEQVRGYGLGVMNARALYYSKENPQTIHYEEEGRAFGPHGEDLVIADSIKHYNNDLSLLLTQKAREANLEVRKTGFKPYIAPALSSGSLSLVATMMGEWHYSATFMGGVYMGAKNRLSPSGTEIEMLNLPDKLWERLEITYNRLAAII